MNQPSYYQTVFFRELVRSGAQLNVFYNSDITQSRRDLGWAPATVEDFGQQVLCGPLDAMRQALRHREATHLVNGLWSIRSFVLASILLLFTGSRVYYHVEHPDPLITRIGIWHLLKCWWTCWLMSWAQGLVVIGRRAGNYYRGMGVRATQVIPFMYFTRRPDGMQPPVRRSVTGPYVVAYVGQFVEWKRVEDLIQAMAVVGGTVPEGRLQLLGAGPLGERYLELARELGLRERVEVRGPLSPVEVWQALESVDVLVLPSRFDGWGLTVNEALQSGSAVICSDGCGAAEVLVENPAWGRVYPAGRVAALASVLGEIARFRISPVQSHVESAIGAVERTRYFLDKVEEGLVTIY